MPHVRSLLEISIALLLPITSPFARLLLARFKKLLFFLHVRNWAFPAFDSPMFGLRCPDNVRTLK